MPRATSYELRRKKTGEGAKDDDDDDLRRNRGIFVGIDKATDVPSFNRKLRLPHVDLTVHTYFYHI